MLELGGRTVNFSGKRRFFKTPSEWDFKIDNEIGWVRPRKMAVLTVANDEVVGVFGVWYGSHAPLEPQLECFYRVPVQGDEEEVPQSELARLVKDIL